MFSLLTSRSTINQSIQRIPIYINLCSYFSLLTYRSTINQSIQRIPIYIYLCSHFLPIDLPSINLSQKSYNANRQKKINLSQVIHCCIHDVYAFSTLNLYAFLLYIMLILTLTAFVSVFCTPLAKSDTEI